MSVSIEQHVTLYRSERFFSAFPSVVTLPDGDILLAFRRAPDHRWLFGEKADADLNAVDHVHFRSHIALKRFTNSLQARDDAVCMPMHAEAGDQDANLFVHSSGRLLQHGFLWYPVTAETVKRLQEEKKHVLTSEHYGAGYLFWGGYVRHSDDDGKTWSDYIELPVNGEGDTAGGPRVNGVVAVRGRMLEKEDGSLLFAGYAAGTENTHVQETRFFCSADAGKTWELQPQKLVMTDVGLQEPSAVRWPEGNVSVFHRTRYNDDHLVISHAADGQAFSKPKSLSVVGHPYDPLVLPDGRLFLVYGYRHDPMGVRARIVSSPDEIEDAEEIVIRDDSPSRDTGYPSATLLPDGRILVAYYIADTHGIRGIEGTILKLD